MQEEMEIHLENLRKVMKMEYPDEIEYFFLAQIDFEVGDIELKVGQAINWFSRDIVRQLPMAHNDGVVVATFFGQHRAGNSSRPGT
jgi:hypothetical protein